MSLYLLQLTMNPAYDEPWRGFCQHVRHRPSPRSDSVLKAAWQQVRKFLQFSSDGPHSACYRPAKEYVKSKPLTYCRPLS